MSKPAIKPLRCFNPFNLEIHRVRDPKHLRHVTTAQLILLNLDETWVDLSICDVCRKKIPRMKTAAPDTEDPTTSMQGEVSEINNDSSTSDSNEISESSASTLADVPTLPMDTGSSSASSQKFEAGLAALNQTLVSLGESPVKKRKLSQQSYPAAKLEKISKIIGEKVLSVNVAGYKNSDILEQLKEAFRETDDKNLKIRILTLCANWTIAEIQAHFDASKHMITVAKKVKEQKGILACANSKRGKRLDDGLVREIIDFYESDEISRIMPGKKDYVTVIENGEKVQKQKRLVLCNLKEAYKEFRQKFPDTKHSSFSKFAELRPKNCILAGASGTHTVCVCVTHQNVKLMLEGAKVKQISETMPRRLETYHDFLEQMVCNPPTDDCHLNNCKKCPGTDHLIESLQSAYDDEMIETVVYKQWVTVDRAKLEIMQADVPDFLQDLSSALQKLLPHAFIAEKQSNFLKMRKENLTSEECIITCDFSENYAFVFQDAIQGVHWNNDQATVHPFVIYYKEDSILKHKSFAAISNCLKHDTVAVHLFLGKIIEIIKNTLKDVKKLIYFTDGAAAQYKNKKNFINLSHHHNDFGLDAEWHFFATSHGKGPCDGIGGTIKRLAARASLQRDQIIKTPADLFNWAKINVPSVECLYFDKEEYSAHEKTVQSRFECAKPITGTKKFHSYIPISEKQIVVRQFSESTKHSVVNIMK